MFSERKTKIELALGMLRDGLNLAFDHLFDKNDIPFESRLKAFDAFVDELCRSYCATHSVSKNLRKSLEAGHKLSHPLPDPPPQAGEGS
jgi:hypothetical protein